MRWYQYRLIHSLFVMLLIGTGFGWISYKSHRAAKERSCIERMTSHGIRGTEDGPIWMREMLNVHFPVVKIEMSMDRISDDAYYEKDLLEDVAMLKDLQVVEIFGRWGKARVKDQFEQDANSDAALLNDHTIAGKIRRIYPSVYIKARAGAME